LLAWSIRMQRHSLPRPIPLKASPCHHLVKALPTQLKPIATNFLFFFILSKSLPPFALSFVWLSCPFKFHIAVIAP
jgi:hypothetical protein